jgi:hypothetical protein
LIYAPIVVFAYRRPEHLQRTLASLSACEGFAKSPVIVYCDGAKNADDHSDVEKTRQVAQEMLGDAAEYRFSPMNKGLSASVIAGVTEVIQRYGRVIVVEDDLLLTHNFLTYMNAALERYRNDQSVFQVSGYMFDTPEFVGRDEAMFMPITVSWGWATWQRAWDHFDATASGWERLLSDKKLRKKFDVDGIYGYSTMLVRQMMGQRDSWAVRWYWSAFQNQALTLFPPTSLVNNIGFDGSGSHGRGTLRRFDSVAKAGMVDDIRFPALVGVADSDYAIVKSSLQRANGRWFGALVDSLRWLATKSYAWRRAK